MELADLNPFLRYADVQPSLLNGRSFRMAYDYRLFYVLRGSGTLILKTGEIPLTDGCAVFLPPETPYYTRSLMRVISLNFDLDQSQRSRPKALDPSPEAEFDPSLPGGAGPALCAGGLLLSGNAAEPAGGGVSVPRRLLRPAVQRHFEGGPQ